MQRPVRRPDRRAGLERGDGRVARSRNDRPPVRSPAFLDSLAALTGRDPRPRKRGPKPPNGAIGHASSHRALPRLYRSGRRPPHHCNSTPSSRGLGEGDVTMSELYLPRVYAKRYDPSSRVAEGNMAGQSSAEQELTVRGESVETIYRNFRQAKYWVNRRYQRKLIWTMEEKQGFIDSLFRGYPVPIVLLAESTTQGSNLEIIDGMQRLNSVVSFIENDYAVDDHYFDLNTTAVTKELLDKGELIQKEPMLDRAQCVQIATYSIPFSIYEFTDGSTVDEVFRRINSGGRKLSRQELRAAGALGHFATAVRRISMQVRGDVSHSDMRWRASA